MTRVSQLDLSIVMPAYQEEERIGRSLEEVRRFFAGRRERWELVVVDDGSADRTAEIVRSFQREMSQLRLMTLPHHCGKGRAVREGALSARGAVVLISDADLAAPLEEMKKLREAIDEGFDGAAGIRPFLSRECVVRQPLVRRISGRLFNLAVRILILPGFSDTQCGFKMFTQAAARELFQRQRIDGFSFDIEILYLAKTLGLRIKEVPINWSAQTGSKVRLFRDSFKMLWDILRIRRLHR